MTHLLKLSKSPILSLFLSFLISTTVFAQDYKNAWEAIGKNDFKQARNLLEKAINNPSTATDAALSLMYIESMNNRDAQGQTHWKKVAKNISNPYPYIYALWFNEGMVGNYGKKSSDQKKILEQIVKDPNAPSMMRASAWYQMGHSFVKEDKFKNAMEVWAKPMNITKWQFVGPFDNISGSGFDKNYPPIAQPTSEKGFKSANESNINWFTPIVENLDGWITPSNNIKWETAVTYAQTFISVESDMDALLGFGFIGSAKVWVNDRLVITEQEPRKTDYDLYQTNIKLKKGFNRLLVQLSFENEDYANFSLRLLDKQGELINVQVSPEPKPYTKDNTEGVPTLLPFFAEKFFEEKVAKEPENPINYILLCETYMRSAKNQEALTTAEKGYALFPESIVFNYLRLAALSKLGNRTELSTALEKLKELDENSMLSLQLRFNDEYEKEKYEDAEKLLNKRIGLFGEDETTLEHKIKILAQQNKIEDMIKLVEEGYKKYPDNLFFTRIMHNLYANMKKDNRGAVGIYEQYLSRNYDAGLATTVANEMLELGMHDKALSILYKLENLFTDDTHIKQTIFKHFYGQKDNKKAKQYIDKLIGIAPFSGGYWEDAALLANQMKDEEGTLSNFRKALHYNPNDFQVRRRIREIENKKDLFSVFPTVDNYDLLKKTNSKDKVGKHNWYYVLDDTRTIVYPERNSEMQRTMIIKIINEKGIDVWKETSLGYNGYRQKLIVEKAEVVKSNGSKVKAEQNGSDLVFPNLEKGDGIIIVYRVESYAYGRMAREFWEKNYFNMFVPVEQGRYALMIAKNIPLSIKTLNFTSEPITKDVEDFKYYSWEMSNVPPLKEESHMRGLADIGKVLHISTVQDWKDITTWYGDVSAQQAKQDYEVKKLAKELFPADKKFSETEKARIIYNWIVKNIRYSSVPFRQSGYVPQLASKVIQTRLGDCKDLATLYAAIAREIGMKANLVLINTRDNGDSDIMLPSMEFNHCIVKVIADGKTWYLELTDNQLPFGSLPNSDLKATALEIPYNETMDSKPFALNPNNRTPDYYNVTVQVQVQNRGDLNIKMSGVSSGARASAMRETYMNLPEEESIKKMHDAVADRFTNTVSVKSTAFGDFESSADTFHYHTNYTVKNEVIEIGELKTFKVPFYNFFFKSNAFQEETRTHDINYWSYEDCDSYTDDVTITLPEGKQLADIPKDQKYTFNGSTYSLKYLKKAPNTLQVIREIKVNRENIPAAQYEAFKNFVDDILAAESKYVSFK